MRFAVLSDPGGSVGGVEVSDGKTTLLLDRAFATSEVTATGLVAAPPSSVTAALM